MGRQEPWGRARPGGGQHARAGCELARAGSRERAGHHPRGARDRRHAPAAVRARRRVMTGDRAVRWTAVVAVVAVAGVAAYVSYWHAVDVVTHHREPGMIGHLYPVVIDGIIVAASMVLLDAARHS